MREKIAEIVRAECGGTLSENEELIRSKKMKSVQLFAIVCALEEEFSVRFEPDEIGNMENFSTIDAMERLVTRKCAHDIRADKS